MKAVSRHLLPVSMIVLFGLLFFFHLWRLDSVPRGMFLDEAANGYEAMSLLTTGADTYGKAWPFYFRAVNDYRGPYFMYGATALFAILEPSVAVLRAVSALYFMGFVFCTYLLLRRLFSDPLIQLFGVLAMGVLPWFFVLSRVAFRVNTQLFFVALSILLVHIAWKTQRRKALYALVAGASIGAFLHSYESSKVIMPLMFVGTVVLLWRKGKMTVAAFTVGAVLFALPMVIFGLQNPEGFSSRARITSYIFDSSPIPKKMNIFASEYRQLWSPSYLLLNGDRELRHSSHHGGQLFWIVALLTLLALPPLLFSPDKQKVDFSQKDPFPFYLIYQLLVAPVASAMTLGEGPHGIRTILMGYYVVLLACYGLAFVRRVIPGKLSVAAGILCIMVLAVESGFYLHDYFLFYPERSEAAWGGYPIHVMFQEAEKEQPQKIVVTEAASEGWFQHNYRFYADARSLRDLETVRLPLNKVDIRLGDSVCIIHTKNERLPLADQLSLVGEYQDYRTSCLL